MDNSTDHDDEVEEGAGGTEVETRFNRYVAQSLPVMVKGMVSALTECLTEQVTALTTSHARSDMKIDRLASSVGAMQEKFLAQETKAKERDARVEQQLEQIRLTLEAMQMGAG